MAPATPNVRPSFASSAGETSDTPHVPGRNHARLVAEIAREFRPRLDTEGFSAVRELGSQLNARGVESNDDAPAHTHKRCKMCGNVCHARMNSCSSCCLPFVDRGSWEPATMPRPGGDVHSETDSDADSDSDSNSDDDTEVDHVTEPTAPAVDAASAMERRRRERRAAAAVASGEPVGGPVASDSADAPTRPGWHDWFNRAGRLREAPTHERGLDPALERSYAALGTAFGATEAEVRIAYRECVRRVHPDSGGSPKQLARVHDALEAIDRDAWSHGEGAAALREELSSSAEPVSTEMGAKKPRVFVSLAVYRDPEGLHTLKDAFDRASDPSRIFAGVHWQHVLAKPSGEEPVVDRLHPAQNMFTRQVEANLGKIQGDEDKVQYLKESMKQQGDNQRELDEKEARWHAKASLDATDGTKWEWAGHVRETRESWECAEGPCRARHMSMRLWGGEEYVLHADSRTRFDHGWDDVLIAELERIQALTNNPAVLTGVPLGYHMRMTPVDNPETYERVGYIPVYGRDEEREHELSNLVVPLRRDRTDDAPSIAAMGICGFGDLLCYPAAVRLAGYGTGRRRRAAATRDAGQPVVCVRAGEGARRGRSPGPPRALPVPRRGDHNLREAVDEGVEDLPAAALSFTGVLRSEESNRRDARGQEARRATLRSSQVRSGEGHVGPARGAVLHEPAVAKARAAGHRRARSGLGDARSTGRRDPEGAVGARSGSSSEGIREVAGRGL